MATMKSYRTAAQQDLTLRIGFCSQLHCYGCGSVWKVSRPKGEEAAVGHAARCRRVPNRVGVASDVRSAILSALGRL
jgi:hypothetical protein